MEMDGTAIGTSMLFSCLSGACVENSFGCVFSRVIRVKIDAALLENDCKILCSVALEVSM
jgi:hypothetical protein